MRNGLFVQKAQAVRGPKMEYELTAGILRKLTWGSHMWNNYTGNILALYGFTHSTWDEIVICK